MTSSTDGSTSLACGELGRCTTCACPIAGTAEGIAMVVTQSSNTRDPLTRVMSRGSLAP